MLSDARYAAELIKISATCTLLAPNQTGSILRVPSKGSVWKPLKICHMPVIIPPQGAEAFRVILSGCFWQINKFLFFWNHGVDMCPTECWLCVIEADVGVTAQLHSYLCSCPASLARTLVKDTRSLLHSGTVISVTGCTKKVASKRDFDSRWDISS